MRKDLFAVMLVLVANILVPFGVAQNERTTPPTDRIQGTQISNQPSDELRSDSQNRDLRERREEDRSARESVASPPEPDIEFQEFVTSSLGQQLPIFGRELFRHPPSTFAPLDRVPVTPDYLIGPGDELLIRAWGQIDVNYRASVDRTGAIYLPKVGAINVAGLRYEQLEGTIRTAIGRVFKNFDLSVTLGQLRSIQVFVVGQVRRPGVYTVSSLSTLVNALFASGGPSKAGSMRRIQLKRSGEVVTTFDLYDLLTNGDKSKDRPLLPGDVIYVPPVGPLVALSGSVNVPAIFELKEHNTLAELIAFAGGLTTTAAGEHAVIERIDGHQNRRADEFPLTSDGLKQELHDGDIIRFLHISPKFDNAVTLRGNVALPGRYPFRTGMKVHDLIPSREFLVTDDYWKSQNDLGRPRSMSVWTGPESGGVQHIGQEELKNQVKRSAAEINWQYAVVQRMNPSDLSTDLLPFNLGKAIEGSETDNLALRAGDVVTIFSQSDMQVPIREQNKFVHLEGEFNSAGVYQVQPGESLRHLIARVGGFTTQAYLFGTEFTRESTREAQQQRLDQYISDLEQEIDRSASPVGLPTLEASASQKQQLEARQRLLAKMRQLRASGRVVLEIKPGADSLQGFPDLVLEDGDRLVVPFRPATVNVIGSVYNANSFVFKPGKTVADYLRISGGATRTGDLKKAFVIRANGETISRQNHSSLITNNFERLRLMPGDTVVVPEKVDTGSAIRGLKDWSQIIGQFGLAAAAVGVLIP